MRLYQNQKKRGYLSRDGHLRCDGGAAGTARRVWIPAACAVADDGVAAAEAEGLGHGPHGAHLEGLRAVLTGSVDSLPLSTCVKISTPRRNATWTAWDPNRRDPSRPAASIV